MPLTHCDVLSLLWRSLRAMGGCFFAGCFRVRDDGTHRRHPPPPPPSFSVSDQSRCVPTGGAQLSRNPLSSLLEAEGKEDAVLKDRENLVRRSVRPEIDGLDLKDEAKFLKACGVLPETPAEIRKLSRKFKDSSPGHDSGEHEFQSWLTNTSPSKLLQKDTQSHLQPPAPIKWATEPDQVDSPAPSSCVLNETSETRISISSSPDGQVVDSTPTVNLEDETPYVKPALVSSFAKTQHKNRSVRFDLESEMPGNFVQDHEKSELSNGGDKSVQWSSPYPTPLQLSDDMQTPGTVFTSGNLNDAPVRSQYVYTTSIAPEDLYHSRNSEAPGMKRNLTQKPSEVEESLSSWLKPASFEDKNRPKHNQGKYQEDRPIIGLVATHWREEEDVPRVSPKGWDGKGIPNSTTKYKEDQKVSWHATPFEERLEKALSEESVISQRKPVDREPVAFEEEEENDTASTYQLHQSFNHPKSVISC